MSDDMQGALPPGWVWTTLGEMCVVERGITFPSSAKHGLMEEGLIACMRTTNVQSEVDWDDLIYIPSTYVKSSTKMLQLSDILISMANSRELVGKVAFVNNLRFNATFGGFIAAIRAFENIDPKYLFYLLRSDRIQRALRRTSSQTVNIANLSQVALYQQSALLAPLNEQCRIVAKIEELLTRLDAGVVALKRAQANLKRYKASVLKAACEGKLVPTEAELARAEGRTYEPADELLKHILAERRSKWEADLRAKGKDPSKVKYVEPQPPDTSGLPELPEGWCWASAEQLSDATRSITYGVIKLGEQFADGIPTLRSSDVRHLRIDLSHVKRISPDIANGYQRTFLRGGEVLVTVRGTLGGVAVASDACRGFNISREVAMISLVEPKLGSVISMFLGSVSMQNWLLRRTKGIAYIGVNIETLKETPIPLAPQKEQQRIVEDVDQRLSVIAKAEVSLSTALARAERLRQSILQRAFSGKLVPQDPSDEPAGALLERIRIGGSSTLGKNQSNTNLGILNRE
jgi:type I restriction enzyme S subunit